MICYTPYPPPPPPHQQGPRPWKLPSYDKLPIRPAAPCCTHEMYAGMFRLGICFFSAHHGNDFIASALGLCFTGAVVPDFTRQASGQLEDEPAEDNLLCRSL